jgi:hypothetical protein
VLLYSTREFPEDGMTATDPDDLDATHPDDHLHRAVTELGDPDVLFRVSPARFTAKLTLGGVLLTFGIVANYFYWVHGPAQFGHWQMVILFFLPMTGAALLWHMYRNRGLHVLVYPTGLLRLRRGEIDSFPWREVDQIRLSVDRTGAVAVARDEAGNPTGCCLPADAPAFKLWNAGLTVSRADGVSAHFGPALTDYPRLAEEVQQRTFAVLWPAVWGRFASGHAVAFDDLELSPAGVRSAQNFLPWKDVKEITAAQKKVCIRQVGKWRPWYLKDAAAVPNPHVLFALVEEARRRFASHAPPPSQPHAAAGDHKAG